MYNSLHNTKDFTEATSAVYHD